MKLQQLRSQDFSSIQDASYEPTYFSFVLNFLQQGYFKIDEEIDIDKV